MELYLFAQLQEPVVLGAQGMPAERLFVLGAQRMPADPPGAFI